VYTIEDLWHKFGELKLSLVSINLHNEDPCVTSALARSIVALGRSYFVPYHRSDPRLHELFQNTFLGSESLWPRGCSNELTVPG
jgi:hypothetical protein